MFIIVVNTEPADGLTLLDARASGNTEMITRVYIIYLFLTWPAVNIAVNKIDI